MSTIQFFTTDFRPDLSHRSSLKNKSRTLIKAQSSNTTSLDGQSNVFEKIKHYKKQAKKANSQYVEAIKKMNQTHKSINKNIVQSQRTKIGFIRLYENRRLRTSFRLQNEQKKSEQRKYLTNAKNKVKMMKFEDQLSMLAKKGERQIQQQSKFSKNRQYKKKLKQQLEENNNKYYNYTKLMYQQQKQTQSNIIERKKKIQQIINQKAKYNYMERIKKQLLFLNGYKKILQDLNLEINSIDENNDTFYLTKVAKGKSTQLIDIEPDQEEDKDSEKIAQSSTTQLCRSFTRVEKRTLVQKPSNTFTQTKTALGQSRNPKQSNNSQTPQLIGGSMDEQDANKELGVYASAIENE